MVYNSNIKLPHSLPAPQIRPDQLVGWANQPGQLVSAQLLQVVVRTAVQQPASWVKYDSGGSAGDTLL
jgi:hypothetical protein